MDTHFDELYSPFGRESIQPEKLLQALMLQVLFGIRSQRQASKISLSGQIFGREVAVTWGKRDRYGRIISKILVNHRDVCLEQVRRGMAWHYKQYARDQAPGDRGAYAEAEFVARAAGVGLWRDAAPVAPWEWRPKK